jgi:hypothetical protein
MQLTCVLTERVHSARRPFFWYNSIILALHCFSVVFSECSGSSLLPPVLSLGHTNRFQLCDLCYRIRSCLPGQKPLPEALYNDAAVVGCTVAEVLILLDHNFLVLSFLIVVRRKPLAERAFR